MKRYFLLMMLACTISALKAQTADSVTNKFNKIPFVPFSVFAKFPDGDADEYIAKNVKYPDSQAENIDGEIVVAYSIDTDGSVVDARLLKNLSPAIDAEILRVFNAMPKWKPAYYHDKPVKVNIGARLMVHADYSTRTINVTEPVLKVITVSKNAIFTAVSGPPTFPGGADSLHRYLAKAISYPSESLKNHKGGKVYLQFIIEKDGTLGDIKAVRNPDDLLTQEAIRVMKLVKYNAGTQNDQPVRVQYIMGIDFDPNNPDKH
ncbi:MAG TPA: energy transducer TonB [Mucilaginibacter sp.]|jgi:TonB family protein|nr:energy transducer TonB [Mucilaginibacter sp.]